MLVNFKFQSFLDSMYISEVKIWQFINSLNQKCIRMTLTTKTIKKQDNSLQKKICLEFGPLKKTQTDWLTDHLI